MEDYFKNKWIEAKFLWKKGEKKSKTIGRIYFNFRTSSTYLLMKYKFF